MQPQLSAFLPIKTSGKRWRHDLARAELLLDSLNRFGDPDMFALFRIAAPREETARIHDALAPRCRFPIEVVNEEEIIPSIASYRGRVEPWRIQQILKLAATANSPTPFTFIFDSDLICTRPTRVDDLIVEGRALYDREPKTVQAHRYDVAAALLNVEVELPEFAIAVTPQILSREICDGLTRRLTELHHMHWAAKLMKVHDFLSPHFYLPGSRRQRGWTEFTLYYLYAYQTGLLKTFHIPSDSDECSTRILSRQSVWLRTPIEEWNLASCFGPEDPSHFVLFQSNKLIEPGVIRGLVDPFLAEQR